MSSSRDQILGRIRNALEQPTQKPVEKPDFEQDIYDWGSGDLLQLFQDRFLATKGLLYHCHDLLEVPKKLDQLLSEKGISKVHVWEPELAAVVRNRLQAEVFTDETAFKEEAESGLTFCERIVARTGSLLFTSRQASGRTLTVYPPWHLVVAFTSQLVPDIHHGITYLKNKYGEQLPSMMTFTTGASRTADIEKNLVLGAHGPKELALFLVHDLHH